MKTENWKNVKLSDICILEKGSQIDTSLLDDSNPYRYINGGIKESGFFSDYNTEGESVLISEGGASCGYINYVNEKFWCGCHCYRLHDIKVFPKYLFHALKANQQRIMNLRTGSAMPNIQKSTIQKFELNIHEKLETQKKIVAQLDKCTSIIAKHKQMVEKYDTLVKSRFIEMFGDDPIENGKWKVETLGSNLIAIDNGKSFVCSDSMRKGKYPAILKLSAVTYGEYNQYENKALLDEDMFLKNVEVNQGDLLFTRKNTPELVGMAAYVFETERNLMMPDLIFRLNVKDDINKIYLWKLINHPIFRERIRNLANGSAKSMSNISKERLQTLKIPVPPLALQNDFAAFVQQIDKSKFAVQKSLNKAEILYKSLMQEYFA